MLRRGEACPEIRNVLGSDGNVVRDTDFERGGRPNCRYDKKDGLPRVCERMFCSEKGTSKKVSGILE